MRSHLCRCLSRLSVIRSIRSSGGCLSPEGKAHVRTDNSSPSSCCGAATTDGPHGSSQRSTWRRTTGNQHSVAQQWVAGTWGVYCLTLNTANQPVLRLSIERHRSLASDYSERHQSKTTCWLRVGLGPGHGWQAVMMFYRVHDDDVGSSASDHMLSVMGDDC